MSAEDSKRIAKNTIYLYFRTFLVLIVSLYTSRLVLKALGATDLGIYNVVGGIVALMAFFQSAQSKATSRFVTYELGKGEAGNPTKIFSACMTIHILIALVVLVLGETIGLWIVNHWIVIPEERLVAALWVYHLAVVTFCVHLVRIPYDAAIIAHEDMSVYAYMSILEVVLKLLVVFTLLKISSDKLIAYSILIAFVAIILFLLYRGYTKKTYREYKFRWLWDKEDSMKILSFSGWTLLGSSANTATQQGVSILLNNYVGLIANAALGFANQVNAALGQFVNSFTTAFNPQIIKLYAQHNYTELHILMNRASKFSFVLGYLVALPLIVNMEFILKLWLVDVPQYTTEFCQMLLVCSVIDATTGVYNTAITASGKIKKYQIGISISFFIDLLLALVILKLGLYPAFVFCSRFLTRGLINMGIGLNMCKRLLNFDIWRYLREVLLPIGVTVAVTSAMMFLFRNKEQSWLKLLATFAISTISIGMCTLFFILTHIERKSIFNYLKVKLLK